MRLPALWQHTVLEGIGAPVVTANYVNLTRWQEQEGGTIDGAAFNPFNCGLAMPGSSVLPGNPDNVQVYANWQTGLAATVSELNSVRYAGIKATLVATATFDTFARAVNASPWGTHFPTVPAAPVVPPAPTGGTMGVTISTGVIAVTGVTKDGHKHLFSAELKDRAGAVGVWSHQDLTDVLSVEGAAGTHDFVA